MVPALVALTVVHQVAVLKAAVVCGCRCGCGCGGSGGGCGDGGWWQWQWWWWWCSGVVVVV